MVRPVRSPIGAHDMAPVEVSVICTARNAASTIGRTLDSILAQDMPNWEMVVVDDGSTDDTVAVVAVYVAADERIKLVTTGGIGRSAALNLALAEAKADLIANLDADDVSHPRRLRLQRAALTQHSELALLATDFVLVLGDGLPVFDALPQAGPFKVIDVTGDLTSRNPICHSSVMMRRRPLEAVHAYAEDRRSMCDYDLWVRLAQAGHRLGQLQLPLVAKRLHAGQKFMHRQRLRYVLAGLEVQVRAMRALGAGPWLWGILPLRFLWGILPLASTLSLRRSLRHLRWPRRQSVSDHS